MYLTRLNRNILILILMLGIIFYNRKGIAEESEEVVFAPDLKIFANYYIDVGTDSYENEFQISRAYLGFKAQLTSWFSTRITYDLSQVSEVGNSSEYSLSCPEGSTTLEDCTVETEEHSISGSLLSRLKYAYINFFARKASLNLRFGVLHTPWMDWIEHIEDTRFLRKVMFEEEYGHPSSDFGFALIGNITNYFSYHAGVYNGEGYHGIEDTRFKDLMVRLSLRPAPNSQDLSGLQISGYAQAELAVPDSSTQVETHRRFGGALTYRLAEEITSPDCSKVREEILAVWFQAFYGQDGLENNLIDSGGFSFGLRVELPAHLFILGRLDYFDPNIEIDNDLRLTVISALGFRPTKGVIIALNYQGELFDQEPNQHMLGIHTEFHL